MSLNINTDILNYTDSITEERERIIFVLSNSSKIDVFFHPLRIIGSKYKLKKIDKIDREFSELTFGNFDYLKVKDYIDKHPINSYKTSTSSKSK